VRREQGEGRYAWWMVEEGRVVDVYVMSNGKLAFLHRHLEHYPVNEIRNRWWTSIDRFHTRCIEDNSCNIWHEFHRSLCLKWGYCIRRTRRSRLFYRCTFPRSRFGSLTWF
jgi:hypothetical protein